MAGKTADARSSVCGKKTSVRFTLADLFRARRSFLGNADLFWGTLGTWLAIFLPFLTGQPSRAVESGWKSFAKTNTLHSRGRDHLADGRMESFLLFAVYVW